VEDKDISHQYDPNIQILDRPIGAVVYVEEALSDASMFKISLRSIGDADDTTQISQVCLTAYISLNKAVGRVNTWHPSGPPSHRARGIPGVPPIPHFP